MGPFRAASLQCCVVGYVSNLHTISAEEIATAGDMPNDVLMFAQSGLSIAMGNA
jgi:hydroxymethylpyrimidine pyrophosphatase-like HAD family hydrolase